MDFSQSGTISGRFSCSGGFNLQTLPRTKKIEQCPVCESVNTEITRTFRLLYNITCKDCGYTENDIVDASGIKEGFVAPAGYKIVNADFSSLEPRCFAFMSNEPEIKKVYQKGLDLYSKVYCDIMQIPASVYSPDPKSPKFLKKLAPHKRELVKLVTLGIPYGAQGPQVARLMGFVFTDTKKLPDGSISTVEKIDFRKGEDCFSRFLREGRKLL